MITNNNNNSAESAMAAKVLTGQALPDWNTVTPGQWLDVLVAAGQQGIAPEQRMYWMLAMRNWLDTHVKIAAGNVPAEEFSNHRFVKPKVKTDAIEAVLLSMSEMGYQLCDWALVIRIHELLSDLKRDIQQDEDNGERAMAETLQLAVAYWQMGQLTMADTYLQRQLPLLEVLGPLKSFHHQIRQDLGAYPWHQGDCESDELLICPLEEQHLSGFSWIFRDRQIAQLCNLPQFGDDNSWFEWLAGDQANPDKQVFALIHHQWGMIGSVSIEVHEGTGYFYYWLGQDFQGCGFGPKAVSLLLDLATRFMGLTCCFAKAYQHNLPSHKAMEKVGFERLTYKLAPPNDDQCYFYRGAQKTPGELKTLLEDIAAKTDVDSRIVANEDALA